MGTRYAKVVNKEFASFPICRIVSAIICKCQSGQKVGQADSRAEILELGQKDLYIDKTESLARYYVIITSPKVQTQLKTNCRIFL